jgi:hypothetical protein
VISKQYLSVNRAGLFMTLTPRRDTTDILAVWWGFWLERLKSVAPLRPKIRGFAASVSSDSKLSVAQKLVDGERKFWCEKRKRALFVLGAVGRVGVEGLRRPRFLRPWSGHGGLGSRRVNWARRVHLEMVRARW